MDLIRDGIVVKVRTCLKCRRMFNSTDGSRLCEQCNVDNSHEYTLSRAVMRDKRVSRQVDVIRSEN